MKKIVILVFAVMLLAAGILTCAGTAYAGSSADDFSTDPNIATQWTEYNYFTAENSTITWNSSNLNLDLAHANANGGTGLYRTNTTRSASDPVTLKVNALARTAGAWGFLGLMITATREQDYIAGTGDSYTLAINTLNTSGSVRYEVKRTYADGTSDFVLYAGSTFTFSGPCTLDIVRDGTNYVFKANGTTLYTTTNSAADFYTTASRDSMTNYQVVVAGDGTMTATVDNFGVPPPVPAGLKAVPGPVSGSVRLDWAAVMNATGYNVKRSLTNSGYVTVGTNVVATNYTDFNLRFLTNYYYVVSALINSFESADSTWVPINLSVPGTVITIR